MTSRIVGTFFAIGCLAAAILASENAPQEQPAPQPFFRLREHRTEYAGPGREEPPADEVDEIRIGYFGPDDPAHPEGGQMWLAARLAVEEANREGGYRGKPFRLVPAWSENPWGTGVAQVARMVYAERVWAIVGGIDGPSTHLAEQVVAKARLPLLSPASTDKTVNLANVPWMFSLVPGDHLQAPVVAEAISSRVGDEPFVLVSGVDHDSQLFAVELAKCFTRLRMAPRYHFKCERAPGDVARLGSISKLAPALGVAGVERQRAPRDPASCGVAALHHSHPSADVAGLVSRILAAKPSAVVLIAGADQSARLLIALREGGFAGLVFGGPAMGRRRFREQSGDAAEGVLFPFLYDHRKASEAEASKEFLQAFETRSGGPPDYAAAHTYDAVCLLVAAVRKAGLNRARIRDAIQELSPFAGVTGPVKWDPLGSNTRPVPLGTIHDARVVPMGRRAVGR